MEPWTSAVQCAPFVQDVRNHPAGCEEQEPRRARALHRHAHRVILGVLFGLFFEGFLRVHSGRGRFVLR